MVICSVYIEFMCFFSAVKSKLLWKETQLEKHQLLLCLLSIVLVHPSFTRNLSALLGKSFNKHNSAIWHVFSPSLLGLLVVFLLLSCGIMSWLSYHCMTCLHVCVKGSHQ